MGQKYRNNDPKKQFFWCDENIITIGVTNIS